MTKTAKLVDRGGHRDWMCPTCGKLMGKVYGDDATGRVTIKTGRHLIGFAISVPVDVTCAACGDTSVAGCHEDAAA